MSTFQSGSLWENVLRQTEKALRHGALHPTPTDHELVKDSGVEFLVRIVSNLVRKDRDRKRAKAAPETKANPFVDYDPLMYVADVSPSHLCLLNKYNVVDHHVLIATREFEHQEQVLSQEDFSALWTCMAEYDSLGFYNGGTVAGASQPHKHLQLVPLPLGPLGPAVPIEPLIDAAAPEGRVGQSKSIPFAHAVAKLSARPDRSPAEAAFESLALYRDMLRVVGCVAAGRRTAPYNLLIARNWMLLVPRSRERFAGISLNALAFAGAFLVRDQQQMDSLKKDGPMHALKQTSRTSGFPN